jgi:hypothetical protein
MFRVAKTKVQTAAKKKRTAQPNTRAYVEDAERHNIRAAFVAGLAHGLGREALLIRFGTAGAAPGAADFREDILVSSAEAPVTARLLQEHADSGAVDQES